MKLIQTAPGATQSMTGKFQLLVTSAMVMMTSLKLTSAGVDNPCPQPPLTRPLNESLLRSGVIITLGTDQKVTCDSVRTCFPASQEDDMPLPVQLLPVEIPSGVQLSFQTEMDILPYEIDADGFRLCDVTHGVPVLDVFSTNESFTLNRTILSPGVHYFMVDSLNESETNCSTGLRINVTVKPIHCPISSDHVCSARGLCLTQYGQTDYSCHCCGEYKGNNCEQYELCPCQHGGHCLGNTSIPGNSACDCRIGFQGRYCEKRVDNMCDVVTCLNNGTCDGNNTHFRCACVPGYNGSHCEVNVNECSSNPCVNGLCVDGINSYKCYCKPGFHGNRCELDYDECASTPCHNHGFCRNLQDNFTCHCHPGFKGRNCSTKVHTCATLRPCRNGARCLEHALSYTCLCPRGFAGTHCEVDIDECARKPCLNGGTCVDKVANYLCLCLDMHAGPNCQYPLDMFGPMIDIRGLREGGAEERAFHVRNMYVVSGTLSCAVVVVIVVLVTCYCRVRSTRPANSILRRHHNYTRHHDDLSQPVDITSVSNPSLSVDAIWEATSLNYDVTQLGSPVRRSSLKPLEV